MAAPSWAPSAVHVAAQLRARTKGTGTGAVSKQEGSFSDRTRPTLDQVNALIETACDEVLASFEGRSPCSTATESAARAAALSAACLAVEISYYPEARNAEASAAEAFERRVERLTRAAATAVIATCPFTPIDGVGSLAPSGAGRDPAYPVLGFGTR